MIIHKYSMAGRKYLFRVLALTFAGLCFTTSLASAAVMPSVLAQELDGGETATDSDAGVAESTIDPSGDTSLDSSGIWALDEADAPVIQAQSAILMDVESGAILYAKNIHTERYPASITKLLTCLIAKEKCSLDETVTFSTDAVYGIERGSSNIGIDEGQTLTMEQCLYGILLASANEVAAAVAEHVAGSTEDFAKLMNAKVKELGGTDSHFVNANGLPNDAHYTSAYDMALIARAFFSDETLSKIAGTTKYHIPATATQPDEIDLQNHHRMLNGCMYGSKYSYPYTVGGKTGYTNVARETLVTCAEKDGKRLVCVILKDEAPYHYEDTKALFEYGFNKFNKLDAMKCLTKDQIRKLITDNLGEVDYQLADQADIMVPDGVDYTQLSTDVETKTAADGTLKGVIRFCYNDREAGNIPFTYTKAVLQESTSETVPDAIETAPENSFFSSSSLIGNMRKIAIFILIIGVALMAAIVTWTMKKEREREIRRREIMSRSRQRRAQDTWKQAQSNETTTAKPGNTDDTEEGIEEIEEIEDNNLEEEENGLEETDQEEIDLDEDEDEIGEDEIAAVMGTEIEEDADETNSQT